MTANLVKIVDSVAASPTVLLDLNAGADTQYGFAVERFDAPPPPLRRTVSSSMLSDGDRISGSAYSNRTITLTLNMIQSSQDTWATTWQTLARLIDQDTFWLMYQPTGATSPIFFKCYRTDVPNLDDVNGAVAYRNIVVNIPADYAAIGLPEDIAAFTITNSPSSGTNRQFYTLPTIKGDVETPLLLAQTTGPGISFLPTTGMVSTASGKYLSTYTVYGNTHSLLARDLTELTAGTDTGAPVTGAGVNYIDGNYRSCSFATAGLNVRLSGTFSTAFNPMPGRYRVLVRGVAPSGLGSGTQVTFTHQIGVSSNGAASYVYNEATTQTVTYNIGVDRGCLFDCGIVQFPVGADFGAVGYAAAATAGRAPIVSILASESNTLAFRYDEIYFIPVETNYGYGSLCLHTGPTYAATVQYNVVCFDGVNDSMRTLYDSTGTAPFAGVPVPANNMTWVGGMPVVRPGFNNYLHYIFEDLISTDTTVFTGRYWPRYLYVRPSST